ncbi:hypothetical protein DNTS_009884 [Danionella cerebrum]|uniref:complement subcomponent C1r n=1 Tax=Danionella cerebrum TaxID=2873325 RepID=A0A553NJR4_9TELE|nr:hypothetical protein DNTS_009884 [Danionella translucida]
MAVALSSSVRSILRIAPVAILLGIGSVCGSAPAMFGELSSPQYPQPYPADIQERWHLEVPHGYQIKLTFNYLEIEASPGCVYDSVSLLSEKKLLGRFCGVSPEDHSHPGVAAILAPGSRLQVVFQADESNHEPHLGFSAFYQAVGELCVTVSEGTMMVSHVKLFVKCSDTGTDRLACFVAAYIDECSSSSEADDAACSQFCLNTLGSYLCTCQHGYTLQPDQRSCILDCGSGEHTELEGFISSPGYPEPSPPHLQCVYNISVEPGFTITLNFNQNFHIEQPQSCLFHWLQVSVPGKMSRRYCGDESPGVLHTDSHFVQLMYHTDGYGRSDGWSLHYRTQRVQCPDPASISNGTVTPRFSRYFYGDYIQVRCNPGHKLMVGKREISSFKSLCQSSGEWHLELPECKIVDCGPPEPLLNGGFSFVSGEQNQYQSVVEYRCYQPYYRFKEMSGVRFMCAADRKWTTENSSGVDFPQCVAVCGMNTEDVFGVRVSAGKQANPGEIPWQLVIPEPRGGAFLISDLWALTAAHVVNGYDRMTWYGGTVNIMNKTASVLLNTSKIIIHPRYKHKHFDNDIALMKMSRRVPLGPNIRPVCLPNKSDGPLEGKTGTVSGFGIYEKSISDVLLYANVRVYSKNSCPSFNVSITENMICAGGERVDTCQGDSGGALVFPMLGQGTLEDPYTVKGIVSSGPRCRLKIYKGYYTKVQNYLDWIEETMEKN